MDNLDFPKQLCARDGPLHGISTYKAYMAPKRFIWLKDNVILMPITATLGGILMSANIVDEKQFGWLWACVIAIIIFLTFFDWLRCDIHHTLVYNSAVSVLNSPDTLKLTAPELVQIIDDRVPVTFHQIFCGFGLDALILHGSIFVVFKNEEDRVMFVLGR